MNDHVWIIAYKNHTALSWKPFGHTFYHTESIAEREKRKIEQEHGKGDARGGLQVDSYKERRLFKVVKVHVTFHLEAKGEQ